MLARSIANQHPTLTAEGLRNTELRLAILRRSAPFFDGVTMIGREPCGCGVCAGLVMGDET